MEHVVFFPAPDGSPGFRRVATLEEAVRLVEHLRNVEGVDEVSCHALTEVPLAFRTYYRVEVPGLAEPEPAAPPVQVEPAPVAEAQLFSQTGEGVEPGAQAADPLTQAVADPGQQTASVPAQSDDDAEPVFATATATTNGHATDGAKSLGFFA